MVIIEGPDRAGKTTLARFIEAKLGYQYHHEGPPINKSALQHYAELLLTKPDRTVFDRLHLGETVYGPIMRGVDLLDGDAGVVLMNRLIVPRNIHVIICLPDFEGCLERWSRNLKLEYVTTIDQFKRIYDHYQELAFRLMDDPFTREHHRVYDFEREKVLPHIHDLPYFHPYHNSVGSTSARFVFVGEIANHATLDLPFFSTSGSSRFLNDALVDAGYREFETAFVNAICLDGRHVDDRLRKSFKGAVLVALGGTASDILRDAGLRATAVVPHPAYWKRFKSKNREEYVDKLRCIRTQFYRQ